MRTSGLPLEPTRRYDAKGAVAPSNKGDNEAVSYTRPYRKTGDLLVGSWTRTVAVLAVAVVVFVASNNSQGIYEVAQNRIDKVIVGLLTDPNQPDVRWCVRETGESTISSIDKGTGQTVRQGKSRFDSKYWLVKVGDRYLITDRQVVTQPLPAGS
jgi:hypothetical protein